MNNLFLEALTISSILLDTIHAKYVDNYLLGSCLKETYKKLDLTEDNIKNSILTIIYNCKKLNKKITDQDLLDFINTEFLKANMHFILLNTIPQNMQLKYKNSGIIYAEINNDMIDIYISPDFLKLFKKIAIIQKSKELDIITHDLFDIYSHEQTHSEQLSKQKINIPGFNANNITTISQKRTYLSHPRELDAHARELATELLQDNQNFNNIVSMLKTNSNYLTNYQIYKDYFSLFGRYKNNVQYQKVFNKFKRRIIDFVLLDESYLDKPELIYTIL